MTELYIFLRSGNALPRKGWQQGAGIRMGEVERDEKIQKDCHNPSGNFHMVWYDVSGIVLFG